MAQHLDACGTGRTGRGGIGGVEVRGQPQPAAESSKVAAVTATVETAFAGSYGDAADDPAIWANAADPAQSLVIATDKKAGLYVYDMQGKVLQFLDTYLKGTPPATP